MTGRRCWSAKAAIHVSFAGMGRPSFFSDARTRARRLNDLELLVDDTLIPIMQTYRLCQRDCVSSFFLAHDADVEAMNLGRVNGRLFFGISSE